MEDILKQILTEIKELKTGQQELNQGMIELKTRQQESNLEMIELKTGQQELNLEMIELKTEQQELNLELKDFREETKINFQNVITELRSSFKRAEENNKRTQNVLGLLSYQSNVHETEIEQIKDRIKN